ncbi:MAG: cytochrome c3 family protein, partial [Anaerolineae bacterium]
MRTTVPMMVTLGLLIALALVLGASSALAFPGWGSNPSSCVSCHKGDPTPDPMHPEWDPVGSYMEVHDSSVGECLTCHEYEGESIHGPWTETPEACARCHRTHSAVEDDLLAMGKDELCLFCHGSAAGLAQTNVLDGILRSSSESLRGGGFQQATMNTDTNVGDFDHGEWMFPVGSGATDGVTSTHTLGVEATMWGGFKKKDEGFLADPYAGPTTTLECVSCHDPHAYGMTYRMLTRRPADSGVAKHP